MVGQPVRRVVEITNVILQARTDRRSMNQEILRHLPSVGQLLEHPDIASLLGETTRGWVTRLVQSVVDEQRDDLVGGKKSQAVSRDELTDRLISTVKARHAKLLAPAMKRVINATGIVVHTNLGRACYPETAVLRMGEAARYNCDLEMDLEAGARGHRGRDVETKLALLTGGQDALIVNNNAAALWLAVRSCADKGRVLLSRGEVVAIGGSFRLHEIVQEAGCELVEVGTTNRTTVADYTDALTPGAVVLKVHRSNFTVAGFTEEVQVSELATVCRDRGHTLIYDAGSGLLESPAMFDLPSQLTVAEDLATGADIVTCSGDKLFGGGQAGLIIGRSDLVAAMRSHPMRRTFRVDKTTLAAIDGTLSHYLEGNQLTENPTLRRLNRSVDELGETARKLGDSLSGDMPSGWSWNVVESESQVGGGAGADSVLPGRMLLWTGPARELERCHLLLRRGDPAVVARISQRGLGLDTRAIGDDELEALRTAVCVAWSQMSGSPKEGKNA